ncbi:hypothetical protein [Nesterenkonia sp. HG001]|uniref:hypothetical protein n=1 Tax=Nesterenkonia sp. HG001 TaxID=2983207 RepID=UPI002AC6A744|nr:hypothetical protein [Nesterenkonia sp. HG001]MDZ5076801.1 hypothetical protein [Nesterenkonia sp. HG001]
MKLFARHRRDRRLDKDLGRGLWRQARDRFARGLDRYHQVIEGVEDDAVHNHLVAIGDELAEQLPSVQVLCTHAHRLFPGEGMDIPGRASELHSQLSKAANHMATTAEAAAMVRLGSAEIVAVRRRADRVLSSLQDAEAALERIR